MESVLEVKQPFVEESNAPQSTKWKFTQGAILVFVVFGSLLTIGSLLGYGVVKSSSQGATAAAKVAASLWPLCNMNGIWTQDTNRCECYQCITGTNCTDLTPEANCRVNAMGGQPFLMEEYWANYTQGNPPNYFGTPANWRGPYNNPSRYGTVGANDVGLDASLNRAIRALHAKFNNVVIGANDAIMITSGATQFWSAALWGIARNAGSTNPNLPFQVFERTPYYPGHGRMVDNGVRGEILNPNLVRWNTSTAIPQGRVIEVFTYPSNPKGDIYNPIYPNSYAKVHDLVYYWPHLSGGSLTARNEQVMFFSLTKLSGHAGTRFGWGIVKNANVASQMSTYISRNNMGPSVDVKWRALSAITAATDTNFMTDLAGTMKQRWVRITQWFSSQSRFQLLSQPDTAYIYMKCLHPSDAANCLAVIQAVGIDGVPATNFGEGNDTVRINLTLHSYAFNLLMQKLAKLTSSLADSVETLKEWASQLPPAPIVPAQWTSEYIHPSDIQYHSNQA